MNSFIFEMNLHKYTYVPQFLSCNKCARGHGLEDHLYWLGGGGCLGIGLATTFLQRRRKKNMHHIHSLSPKKKKKRICTIYTIHSSSVLMSKYTYTNFNILWECMSVWNKIESQRCSVGSVQQKVKGKSQHLTLK